MNSLMLYPNHLKIQYFRSRLYTCRFRKPLSHPDVDEQLHWACRVPVTTPGGKQFWYSPLHRLAGWKLPAIPLGHFLAEEMVSIESQRTRMTVANPFH